MTHRVGEIAMNTDEFAPLVEELVAELVVDARDMGPVGRSHDRRIIACR
jgi:hypothetical protein